MVRCIFIRGEWAQGKVGMRHAKIAAAAAQLADNMSTTDRNR